MRLSCWQIRTFYCCHSGAPALNCCSANAPRGVDELWRWMLRCDSEDQRMGKMQRSIAMAAVLGCKNWVIHPIMPFGEQDRGSENARKV